MTSSNHVVSAEALAQVRQQRYTSRKRINQVALLLSLLAMSFGLF
ncbi:MAG: hypothetical protein RLZZ371_2266, partial [Pseudomonadota bacterium]